MPPSFSNGTSYMRSISFKNSSMARTQAVSTPCTPHYSNQHWLSTFRQGLDEIDELEEEITGDTGYIQEGQSESLSSQGLPATGPRSSSPLPTTMNSDFSAGDPLSSSTSLCSSLCYSDALDSPIDAGDVDMVFLEQLQVRLAVVARSRERQYIKCGNDPSEVASSTSTKYPKCSNRSTLATRASSQGHLVPGVSDDQGDLQVVINAWQTTKKRTRSISSQSHEDGSSEWRYPLLPPQPKRPRLSKSSHSSSTDSFISRESRPSFNQNMDEKENEGFASTTATMRRALSLRSHDTLNDVSSANSMKHKEIIEKESIPVDWVPTVPCSPSPAKPPRCLPPPRRPLQTLVKAVKNEGARVMVNADSDTDTDTDIDSKGPRQPHDKPIALGPVPIIAPPFGRAPALPLSMANLAKKRIERFRERERELRIADDLVDLVDHGKALSWENFGVDQNFGEEMVKWILQVLPFQVPSPLPSLSSRSSSRSSVTSSAKSSFSSTSLSPLMCLSTQLSSSSSSLKSLRPPRENKTPYKKGIDNLIHQLRTCPETRFMGAYMLMRFFWCLSVKKEGNGHLSQAAPPKGRDSQSENDGMTLSAALGVEKERLVQVMWDIVVGCLAISVKMHRDFLPPLFPVYSQVFEDMAPHAKRTRGAGMDYDQFEGAQRLILFALKYNLGASPQALLYEVWESGTIRDMLLHAQCGPDEGDVLRWWGAVQRETWRILYKVVIDPCVLFFPLSVLTGCALLLALEDVLVFERYALEVEWWCELEFRQQRQQGKGEMGKEERRRRRQAKTECEGVVEDIKEMFGIGDSVCRECVVWLKKLYVD